MATKLLIVDSDPAVHQWVEFHLNREGLEVICYDDGLSGLDMLSKLDPDMVLADYNMAGINIFLFCDKLRQKSASKDRPLLLLVNPEQAMDQDRLRAAGVVGFIEKPLKLEEVMDKITVYSDKPLTSPYDDVKGKPAPQTPEMPSAQPPEPSPSPTEEEIEALKIEELLGWSLPEKKTVASPPPGPKVEEKEEREEIPAVEEDDRTIVAERPITAFFQEPGRADTEPQPPVCESGQQPQAKTAEEPTPEAPSEGQPINGTMAGLTETPSLTGLEMPPSTPTAEAKPSEAPTTQEEPITQQAQAMPSEATSPEDHFISGIMAELGDSFPSTGPEALPSTPTPEARTPDAATTQEESTTRETEPVVTSISPEAIEATVSEMAREIIEKVAWEVVPTIAEALIKEELEKLQSDSSK